MTPLFDFIDEANLHRPMYLATGSTDTASYNAPNPPPARQIPSHFLVDPQLPQKMRESLRSYLTTKCGLRPVSDMLVARRDLTQRSLVVNPQNLTDEGMVFGFFWMNVVPFVSDFVFDVDRVEVQLGEAPASYGAKPDGIWGERVHVGEQVHVGERVHVELKSVRTLLRHAPEILAIGRANNGRGSALVLGQQETDARSIIFKIGISMATRNLTWGILTSGLVSMFFYRHVAPDANGEPHHILSCSELVYCDAARPSLAPRIPTHWTRGLRAWELLYNPILSFRFSKATHSKIGQHPKSTAHLSSAQDPCGSTSTDIFPPQMSHSRHPLLPMKYSRTLAGVRKVATLEYRAGVRVRKQCLWKCPTLRVQFVASYWPDLFYNVRRVRSDGSLFSRHTGQGTTYRFLPPHLKLYERLGRGEFGQVLDGTVFVPQSRTKHNVVAKLFLRAHLDKLYNEILHYRTRLVGLRNKVVPKVFGAFVIPGSGAAEETMEKWGLIVMEKCGSAVQSVDELTVDQRPLTNAFALFIKESSTATLT